MFAIRKQIRHIFINYVPYYLAMCDSVTGSAKCLFKNHMSLNFQCFYLFTPNNIFNFHFQLFEVYKFICFRDKAEYSTKFCVCQRRIVTESQICLLEKVTYYSVFASYRLKQTKHIRLKT